MGIFCEINLFKPSDGAYKPGETVSGLIKFAVDEPIEFKKVTTSLKGIGTLTLKTKDKNKEHTYSSSEVYVDIDKVEHENITVPIDSYEIKFSFVMPYNIPSSLNVHKEMIGGSASCKIMYYIRIKFERPGFFERNKHFKKEITLVSEPLASAAFSRSPLMYGETKKIMQLFSNESSIVKLKATILNSIIPAGGKIEIFYEVENKSNLLVKSVKTKLVEVHSFDAGHKAECECTVPNTDSKTTSIACGETQTMSVEIDVPSDLHSLEFSKLVSRKYMCRIVIALPFPHRNMKLNIPVQIGVVDEYPNACDLDRNTEGLNYNDPPPSYWESMHYEEDNEKNVIDFVSKEK